CDSGALTSNGYNFSDDSTCGLTQPTDHPSGGSPALGVLADNGGPTMTLLPATGSPLIDAIPGLSCQADGATGITTDQRGIARPQSEKCDIGAVEVAAPTPTTPSASPVAVPATFTG